MKYSIILITMSVGLFITVASCSDKSSEQQRQESIRIADSIAREEAFVEQERINSIRQDSLRQDSVDKIEKFKAAIPTFNQVESGDPQKLFSKLGYKITTKRYYDIVEDEYRTHVSKAVYELNDSMKVIYQSIDWGFAITITGAPEARDRFYSDAKASIAKSKREFPEDCWIQEWYAKISGDKITVCMGGD